MALRAPAANLIVAILFTIALPALIAYLVIRIRRERRARNATVIDDFMAPGPHPHNEACPPASSPPLTPRRPPWPPGPR